MHTESGANVVTITVNIDDLKTDLIIFPYTSNTAFSREIHFHSFFNVSVSCLVLLITPQVTISFWLIKAIFPVHLRESNILNSRFRKI